MKSLLFALAAVGLLLVAWFVSDTTQQRDASIAQNPLTEKWTGPYGGVPAFDKMDLAYLTIALETGMHDWEAEIEAIANDPTPANFDNTIAALERVGSTLKRVQVYLGLWERNLSSPEFREMQQELAPRLSDFFSRMNQNPAVFARVKAVYQGPERENLTAEQQRVLYLIYTDYVREGAELTNEDKKRHAAINKRLSELSMNFGNNILADEEDYVLFLDNTQLGGLPSPFLESAAAEAVARGQPGHYAILNTRSSAEPFLNFSDQRQLRERVWRAFYNRGDNGGKYDNNALIAEILTLRTERSRLMGYRTYADWALESRMAKEPARAMSLMESVLAAALAQVNIDMAEMQRLADVDGVSLEAWDYRYYAEKLRTQQFDLDMAEIQQYLQLDKLIQAIFYVADRILGLKFEPVRASTVPVFHEDVTVWEVTERKSGAPVGLLYMDLYTRTGKKSGAWADSYRAHSSFDGPKLVLASINSNFIKGVPGEPVLISWDDAILLFHEFGHALHLLSSRVGYPSSTNFVVWDYIEFPSQLLEHWLMTDEVIDQYLLHYQTGKPMPGELIDKIHRAATFNIAFAQAEYLASALIDMKFHTANPEGLDPGAFERQAMVDLGMPTQIPMRHRGPQFAHVFSDESYAAGYYGYLWARVLAADAAEAFQQSPGGFYDTEVAAALLRHIFSIGFSVEPGEAYRNFRGRDASPTAVMRAYGFSRPETQQEE